MSRLSIEITREEHQRIEALAAINGMTIKEYILKQTIKGSGKDEGDPCGELKDLLDPRIAAAERGEFARYEVEDLIDDLDRENK